MAGQHIFYDGTDKTLSVNEKIKISDYTSNLNQSGWQQRSDFDKIVSNKNTNKYLDMRQPEDEPLNKEDSMFKAVSSTKSR